MTPDPGWGIYDGWSRAPTIGQMTAPGRGGVSQSGGFDLVIHFHGHYPIRKEFVQVARGPVLVGIDLGISSTPYTNAFTSPHAFTKLLESVEAEMARRTGRKDAHVRKLALSAWSAGYGAIAQILTQPAGKKVDAVILLDSVHTGYQNGKDGALKTGPLEPFVQFAKKAAGGSRFMFQSYSSIVPPGYASTKEVAHHVIDQLKGKPRKTKGDGVLGLKMFERYDRGNYHARGYDGQDKPDHCAHLGLMKTVFGSYLARRWNSPKGRAAIKKEPQQKAPSPTGGLIHVVASGQSLGSIARKYGTTVKELRAANGLTKGKPIHPGDELVIPKTAKKPPKRSDSKRSDSKRSDSKRADSSRKEKKTSSKRTVRRVPPGMTKHVVADGQSLRAIAKRYRTSVNALLEANGMTMKESRIHPGDELLVPEPKPKKPASKKAETKKAETKKPASKKAETKKPASKKAETKKSATKTP